MAKPHHELLAHSLKLARQCAQRGIIHATHLSRLHQNRLSKDGWLTRIIRGWYLLKQPTARQGDSTAWYASYWDFVSVYLSSRFGHHYCLSASTSIELHLGTTRIPKQVLVMVKKGGSSIIHLPFHTSLVIYQEEKTFPAIIDQINNINVMPLTTALYRISPQFFQQQPGDAEIALRLVENTALSREMLTGTNVASSSRIIGAYLFLNEKQRAKQLQDALIAAGYQCEPVNPFVIKEPLLTNGLIGTH